MKHISIADIQTWKERDAAITSNTGKKWLRIGIKYKSDFQSAKVLRDFVVEVSNHFGITNTWKSRLVLIADELNNNAMEYGSKQWDTNIMRIKVKVDDGQGIAVKIEVEDSWKGKKSKNSRQMEELRGSKEWYDFGVHNSIRWRGLFLIISKLVEELYFRDSIKGGLIVWIKKNIQKD